MRSLFWKEVHDLRAWLLGGAALIAGFELLLRTHGFRGTFEGVYLQGFLPILAAGIAIALGAGQVARERHRRTLDYLLMRPVRPGSIVWAKFLAGSLALAILLTGFTGIGFLHPQTTPDTALRAIRELITFPQMLFVLLPRFWVVYALALLFSVMVDRGSQAAAAMTAAAIGATVVFGHWLESAPFTAFVYWPAIDPSGGLLLAARDGALCASTAAVCGVAAIAIAAIGAALLNRSAEHYLGYRGLVLAALGVAAAVTAAGAVTGPPRAQPVGVLDLPGANFDSNVGLVAAGGTVAAVLDDIVLFSDFSNPAKPTLVRDVHLPLWSTGFEFNAAKAAWSGGTLYLTGTRKAVPVDQAEIAMVKPDGSMDSIPLGPQERAFVTQAIVVGPYVLVGYSKDRVSSLRVFETAAKREVVTLEMDRAHAPAPGVNQSAAPLTLCRRGSYLYLSLPNALVAVDITNPRQPMITARIPYRPPVSFLYGFPRPMASQGGRLFAIEFWPEGLASYDLSDPAHPRRSASLTWHAGWDIASSDQDFYVPWNGGALEARAAGNQIESRRYLQSTGRADALAIDGGMIYMLAAPTGNRNPQISAFQK